MLTAGTGRMLTISKSRFKSRGHDMRPQTHWFGCVHCALYRWRHVPAAGRICSRCSLEAGKGFFNDTEEQSFLTLEIRGVEDTAAFRDVLAMRVDLALAHYFDDDGKVRALRPAEAKPESHREMLLLGWVKGMLEALESGAEAWRIVSPERF